MWPNCSWPRGARYAARASSALDVIPHAEASCARHSRCPQRFSDGVMRRKSSPSQTSNGSLHADILTAAMHTSRVFLLIVAAFAHVAGCGGSSAPAQREVDRAFAAIQVHEAAIERERGVAEASRGTTARDCAQTCAASDRARIEQQGLCELARELEDADARLRCERARRIVGSLVQHASSRCRCSGEAQ
jgi:hypothetical protein